jgi:hypothetical protein
MAESRRRTSRGIISGFRLKRDHPARYEIVSFPII